MRTYSQNRDKIAEYFNKTGFRAWEALTNETPVSKIRLKVRQSREKMRRKILSILPNDLSGKRVLDAGCGPGQFSIELAQRGASVLGIDISSNLIEIAKKRLPEKLKTNIGLRANTSSLKLFISIGTVVSIAFTVAFR